VIKRFLSLSIRTHLIVLVCFLTFPYIITVVYSGLLEREKSIKDAQDSGMRFVNTLAAQQQSMVVGAEQLTMALSLLPVIQSQNKGAANAILSNLPRKDLLYSIITISDKTGLIWASSVPSTGKAYLTNRKYFHDVLRTGIFTSGGYVIGRITKKPILVFGSPVINRENVLSGVISIGLLFDYAQDVFEKAKLPTNTSFSILDHQGVIIYSNSQDIIHKNLQGSRDLNEEIFAKMRQGPDAGTFTAAGNDGKVRLFAYRKLRLSPEREPYLYIRASITQAAATEAATAKMYKYLLLLVLIFVFGISVSWLIGKRAIADRVMMLKMAARKLSEGIEQVNVSSEVEGGELGELAITFDNMAAALSEREKVILESQQRLSQIIEFLPDATLVINREGKVLAWNRAIETMTGVKSEEMIGKGNFEYALPFYGVRRPILIDLVLLPRPELEEKYTGIYWMGDILVGEAFTPSLPRRETYLSATASVLRDGKGEVVAAIECIRDNTDRKRSEEALQESEERFRAIFELSTVGKSLTAPDGKLLQINKAIADMLGYTIDEIQHINFAQITHPDDVAESQEYIRVLLADEQSICRFEKRYIHKNGEIVWADISTTLLRDNHGTPLHLITSIVDITDRKKAEEQLKKTLYRLRKSFSATVQVLVSAVETRDPYTSGHQIRSADLARTIAKELGLPAERIDGIRMAGAIHDIGKMSVPVEILTKPTKLSELEFSLIKEHAKKGFEMLKDVESPWPLAEIIYQHHERMDGSGYPRNLKGEEILLEARILAIADVVEAMASHRPYRPAIGLNAALAEIENYKGKLYDANAVDACLRLFREKGFQLEGA